MNWKQKLVSSAAVGPLLLASAVPPPVTMPNGVWLNVTARLVTSMPGTGSCSGSVCALTLDSGAGILLKDTAVGSIISGSSTYSLPDAT